MSGSRSRRKGHDWEREVVRDMRRTTGRDYRTSRSAAPDLDAKGVDVFCLGGSGFAFQAKAGKQPRVRAAFREVAEATKWNNMTPVAAIRFNRGDGMEKDDLAVLRWNDFLAIAQLAAGIPCDPVEEWEFNVHASKDQPGVPGAPEDGIEGDGGGPQGLGLDDGGVAP